MKIKRAHIAGFGKFVDTTIEFSPNAQLFFGENEAGKTTIFQFIQCMLFGFPRNIQNRRDYRPFNVDVFGGDLTLELIDGEYRIERYKAKNKGQAILHLPNGELAGENEVRELLYPLNQETFQQVFTMNQDLLNELNNVTEENLNKQLFALGISGTNQLMATQKEAQIVADSLYKPRGTNPLLNQLFSEYDDLSQKISQKKVEEVEYKKVLRSLENVQKDIDEKEEQVGATESEIDDLRSDFSLSLETMEAIAKEVNQPIYAKKERVLHEQSVLNKELGDLEERHPFLSNINRRHRYKPSKIGLYALIFCFLLAIGSIVVFDFPASLIGALIILAVGFGVAYIVGVNNRRNSSSFVKNEWNRLHTALSALEDELVLIEQEFLSKEDDVNDAHLKKHEEVQRENKEKIEKLTNQLQELRQEVKDLQYEQQERLFEKNRMESDGSLDEFYQEKEELTQRIREQLIIFMTKRTKIDFIDQMLENLSQNQLPDLLVHASEVLKILTNAEYTQIYVQDGHFLAEHKNGKKLSVISLSTATKDQLILSLRFAFLLLYDTPLSPVMIDDGWLNYDMVRKQQLVDLFKHFGDYYQLIVFSSDTVMKEYFEKESLEVVNMG